MDISPQILLFGNSAMLGALAADLRASSLLTVTEQKDAGTLEALRPDVVLVDAAQIQPEQFRALIPICPTILSVDPLTYQLTVLASPHWGNPLAETARVIELLSFTLNQSRQ